MILTRKYAMQLLSAGKATEIFTDDGGFLIVSMGQRAEWTSGQACYVAIHRLDTWRTDHYLATAEDFARRLQLIESNRRTRLE